MTTANNPIDELEVIQDFILFQFEDELDGRNRNAFHEKTESGIILQSSYTDTMNSPRWIRIIAVGPDVPEDLKVGTRALIEAMKWTRVTNYKGARFARSEAQYVLAVDDDVSA